MSVITVLALGTWAREAVAWVQRGGGRGRGRPGVVVGVEVHLLFFLSLQKRIKGKIQTHKHNRSLNI
jgi:hypothetical protein